MDYDIFHVIKMREDLFPRIIDSRSILTPSPIYESKKRRVKKYKR